MRIKCLFGQMEESYEGQYAPELLCAIDEFTDEENSHRWDDLKAEALKDGYAQNFISLREVEIDIDQDTIRRILLSAPVVDGNIVKQEESHV